MASGGPLATLEGDKTRSPEPTLIPDPARTIRQQFADELRTLLASGRAGNPLWEAAGMAERCKAALATVGLNPKETILDMTFGDIESRLFEGDEGQHVREGLGQDSDGPKRKLIEAHEHQLLAGAQHDHTKQNPFGYDRSGIGDPRLRARFAEWINGFGLPFVAEQTILAPGSFSGIHNTIGALAYQANKIGLQADFLGTGPGFSNIAQCAIMQRVPIQKIDAEPMEGYCPTSQTLTESLGKSNLDVSILYLTPITNPTSTVYNPETFRRSIESFVGLRPNGVIILDLAYIEYIPLERAIKLLNQITPEIRKRIIFSSSMSKLFGDPGLRMADLHTDNDHLFTKMPNTSINKEENKHLSIFQIVQEYWKLAIVTISRPTQFEALAIWKYVTLEDRENLYRLLRARQTAVIQRMMSVNDERSTRGLPPIIDTSTIHRDVPLYLYAQLADGVDFLDFFIETGILGAPGVMFQDHPNNNMLRMSMGIESTEEMPE